MPFRPHRQSPTPGNHQRLSAYGTHDITSDLCDLVPLYFIQHGKSNLTHKRYIIMEHNFFEVGENGRADYAKEHWKAVMQAFVDWTFTK